MASVTFASSPNLGFRPLSSWRSRSSKLPHLKSRNLQSFVRSDFSLSQTRLVSSSDPVFKPCGTSFSYGLSLKRLNSSTSSLSKRLFRVRASASSVAVAPASQPWQGAGMKPLIASIATGVIFWFVPVPSGVTRNAWQLLAIFLATIVGIITLPLPLGAVALMRLGAAVLTKTLTFAAAFSAFGDPIPWLIALAFFFARGFIKTGLGNRVAYQFVSLFGSSSLGLGYSLVFSEALLAPAIPSVSARAGGISSSCQISVLLAVAMLGMGRRISWDLG